MEKLFDFVRKIWNNPSEIEAFNKTNICLIPKVEQPQRVIQFQPMSFYNTTYKVATKVVVDKLKISIPKLVSPYQHGFVLGRNTNENIIIVKEVFHNMHKMKDKKRYFVIKVDIPKSNEKLF